MNTYRNASSPFCSTPVSFSENFSSAQPQQQKPSQHYSLLNLSSPSEVGSRTTTPLHSPNLNVNPPVTKRKDPSQLQQTFLENLYKTVALREKNTNQLHEIRKTRKRLSDSLLIQQTQLSLIGSLHSHLQQQQLQQQLQQQQQHIPNTLVFQHDQNNNSNNPNNNSNTNSNNNNNNNNNNNSTTTFARRRSARFHKLPTILQTIYQGTSLLPQNEPQKVFVIRHGERVDSTFGANWLDQVFDKATGAYQRFNLNLPKKLVTRKDLKDFLFDPPLTELGLHECQMVGEELAAQGVKISHVYSSPALRCIQTADKILEGLEMRERIAIRVEPCLFEFLKWYPVVPVKWPFLDLDELSDNGYNVDQSYVPFYPIETLRKDEDELMFYTRSHFITTSILKNHDIQQGNILFVGHASTIEVCTRQLIGGQPRVNDLKFLVLRVPFLSMHCVTKQLDGSWRATKPPISPNKHAAVEPFDWRFFK